MKKLLISMLVVFSLVGCATTTTNGNINIDESLLQECPPLPKLESPTGNVDLGNLVLDNVEIAGIYQQCAEGKSGLIGAVREIQQNDK